MSLRVPRDMMEISTGNIKISRHVCPYCKGKIYLESHAPQNIFCPYCGCRFQRSGVNKSRNGKPRKPLVRVTIHRKWLPNPITQKRIDKERKRRKKT